MEFFFLTLSLSVGGAGFFFLWHIGRSLMLKGRIVYLIASLLPPLQLLAYYFLLPLPVILASGSGYSATYGIQFSQANIAFIQVLILALSGTYLVGFWIAFGPSKQENYWSDHQKNSIHKALWIFFLCLVLIDLYYRVNAISSGTYFSWMRKFAGEDALESSSLFFIFIGSLAPFLAAFATYFSREKRITLIYLAVLIALVVLEGKRTVLVTTVLGATAVYLLDTRFAGTSSKKLTLVGAGFILIAFFMSTILDVRRELRSDVSSAIADPVNFLFEATGSSILGRLGLTEKQSTEVELKGAGFTARSQIHLITFATIVSRYFGGYELLPSSTFFVDTKRAFPSILVGKKSSESPGVMLANHFDFAPTKSGHDDPGSTVYQAIFAIFGPLGAMTLALFSGLMFGYIFRFIASRYGSHGWVLATGFGAFLFINGNNYSSLLVNLRHIVMLLVILEFFTLFARLNFNSSNNK